MERVRVAAVGAAANRRAFGQKTEIKIKGFKAVLQQSITYIHFNSPPIQVICPAGRRFPAKASEVVGTSKIFAHCALFHRTDVTFHCVGPSVVFSSTHSSFIFLPPACVGCRLPTP